MNTKQYKDWQFIYRYLYRQHIDSIVENDAFRILWRRELEKLRSHFVNSTFTKDGHIFKCVSEYNIHSYDGNVAISFHKITDVDDGRTYTYEMTKLPENLRT